MVSHIFRSCKSLVTLPSFAPSFTPVRTADFSYDLPPELIAQEPVSRRDESRMLVLSRGTEVVEHRKFQDLVDYIQPGDVLVLNDSRVIPARLRGRNEITSGEFELFLAEENSQNDWWALVRPGRRARIGTRIRVCGREGNPLEMVATVLETNAEGHRRLLFSGVEDIGAVLEAIGQVPLPPYIRRLDQTHAPLDRERYQTIFAAARGSVAAPTAGLHFTPEVLAQVRAKGGHVVFITLHVGLGTFAPVKTETLAAHTLHEERFELGTDTAAAITAARREGRRVLAVGTTTVRVLETIAARHEGLIVPASGRTRIFIYPPYHFRAVDALLTNFHLPNSTLLMLVSAFCSPGSTAGRKLAMAAYAQAVKHQYRFFSYGDAMLIL